MADDVLINKAATIERCVKRAREAYDRDPATLPPISRVGGRGPEYPPRLRGGAGQGPALDTA